MPVFSYRKNIGKYAYRGERAITGVLPTTRTCQKSSSVYGSEKGGSQPTP